IGFGHGMAVAAHPAFTARWNAQHQCVIGNVIGNDSPGADKSIPADRGATDDGGIGPDGGPAADQRALVKMVPHDLRARVVYVGENARRAAEHVVFQDRSCIDRNVVLNLTVIADHNLRGNTNVLAQVTVGANPAILHDMRKMPDLSPGSNLAGLIYIRGLVNK